MRRVIALIVLMMTTCGTAAAAASAPSSKPAASTRRSSSSNDPARAAVRSAATTLAKEYEAYLKNPRSAELRSSGNYFKDHPSKDVNAEAIASALLGGRGDPRESAYIRWQLLSGLPETLDPQIAKELLTAYRASPGPAPRPGIGQEDQQRLYVAIQGKKESDVSDLKAAIGDAVSRVARDNAPVLGYRDELYKKLPKTPEAFAAAVDDLTQRTNAAAETKDLVKSLAADVRNWAATANPPPDVLARVARGVRALADAKGPQYYDEPYWYERGHVLKWRSAHAAVETGHTLKDLAVYLEEQSQQPPMAAAAPIDAAAGPHDSKKKSRTK
jgi:hypothetical protein